MAQLLEKLEAAELRIGLCEDTKLAKHVAVFVADQTYEWVGMQKHGRRRVLQRHDAHGMPIQITNEVYINSIKVSAMAMGMRVRWYRAMGMHMRWLLS